jgi:hypothetical protein
VIEEQPVSTSDFGSITAQPPNRQLLVDQRTLTRFGRMILLQTLTLQQPVNAEGWRDGLQPARPCLARD